MSLGTYFKRIFNRNVRRSRFAKKHAAPNVSMINQVLPKENSVFVSVPEPETDFPETSSEPDSTIIIIYQDENHNALRSPEIISGNRGDKLNVTFKEFENFDLIKITGFTSVFSMAYGAITLTYRKKNAGLVWIFCQDMDDRHFLQKPVFIRGGLNDEYSLSSPAVLGYSVKHASGPVTGFFKDRQQVVTYYYRRDEYADVSYDIGFLRFKDFYCCSDAPNGRKTRVVIAKNTVWQIFETIELVSGEKWHCLGGNIWACFNHDLMEYSSVQPQKTLKLENRFSDCINLKIKAKIDFVPNKKLFLYDRPFGTKISSIPDGKIVTLTARHRENGIVWFKIGDFGWTIFEYLKF
ncbi:hypothetical protein GKD00_05910 [Lactobacillus ruminis]|uniref:MucBP domain-containing protein n=1 Tax=Ligilactobacillus ruminis TaxID=1623 RepID=UPI001020534A|nr:MucBP domain-containing protein [Ligilactobacillus ruminis]MSB44108.1 hypothetical protein [Ligilactobacillus ruminis]MSB54407.1 hypothetical protein [Ligilactobacillus ruminis]MSB56442.1 hypothetical protein [Ligilactobacillus ruminis]MSB81500.1 hypothetical protein [Ligilactobacillus ruminis]MSB90829.1 hypothetical protein [Ligilactobacillus ruminis]